MKSKVNSQKPCPHAGRLKVVFAGKALLLLILCLPFRPAKAQIGYGPEVGAGLSYMRFVPNTPYVISSRSPVFSGRVGGLADLSFNRHIYFQPGLFLSLKGDSRSYSFYYTDSTNETISDKISLGFIELPVSVVFKTGMQGTGRFFLGAGATFSYLVAGSVSRDRQGHINGAPENYSLKWSVNDSDFKRFDIGVNVTAGYEMPTGLYFRLYFTSGSNNIGRGGEIDKNRMVGIGAGYFFGKGRNIKKETEDLIAKPEDVR